jgi:predicted small integral membrane protein
MLEQIRILDGDLGHSGEQASHRDDFKILVSDVAMGQVGAIALIVSYGNVVDYDSNYQFVSHVMSMDTVRGHALMNRAITDKAAWSVAYAVIIAIEGLTAVLLVLGALVLLVRIAAPAEVFNRAKVWAVVGMTLGLWPVVFRLPGRRRRILRDVAVDALERAAGRVSHRHGVPWSVDFRQPARRRAQVLPPIAARAAHRRSLDRVFGCGRGGADLDRSDARPMRADRRGNCARRPHPCWRLGTAHVCRSRTVAHTAPDAITRNNKHSELLDQMIPGASLLCKHGNRARKKHVPVGSSD